MSDEVAAAVPESEGSGTEALDLDDPEAQAGGEPEARDPEAREPEVRDVERELREAAQRVQADFENYRKRVRREQNAIVERATEGLVEQLLPVLDSFELALDMLGDAEEKVRKGVELVYAELLGVLERAGLERIATDGSPFDPNVHEAVLSEEGDGDPVVAETMRGGYRLKGKVLRPAMVKVAR
ncbi:MAG: nucleotide exchange factor GrpE [Acidimicrobiia bacterium]|nr:nucleotide exchange factor GrpE [Acidimicrobiia bacterium]